MQSFSEIKTILQQQGLISARNREVAPYKYHQNGATVRRRGPGEVALAVAKLAGESANYPEASWSGKWPRTKSSIDAESVGSEKFWRLVEKLSV